MRFQGEKIIAKAVVSPYYLNLRADGIMYVRISSEKEESIERVKEAVKKMGELVNHQKVPLLACHDRFALPGKENVDYWATRKSCPWSKADAIILNSDALKLVAEFYLKFRKPKRPTRLFADEKEAVRWLRGFQ